MRILAITASVACGFLLACARGRAATGMQCSDCTAAEMHRAAVAAGHLGHTGPLYVWDPGHALVRKYLVACGARSKPSRPVSSTNAGGRKTDGDRAELQSAPTDCASSSAEDAPVEASVAEVVSELSALYRETGGTLHARAHVPLPEAVASGSVQPTAHRFLANYNLQQQVLQWCSQSCASAAQGQISAHANYVLAHADAVLSLTQGVQMTFTVTLQDGSVVVLVQKLNEGASYLAHSAKDSEGNFLPEANSATYQGTYTFTNSANVLRFMELIGALGGQHTGSNTVTGTWTCPYDYNTKTLSCSHG